MSRIFFGLGLIIPLYVIRFTIFGIPTNVLEIGVGVVFVLFLLQFKNYKALLKLSNYWQPKTIIFGSLLLLASIGVVISEELRSSLGIWKAYFVLPSLVLLILAQMEQKYYISLIRGIIGSGLVVAIITIAQVVVLGLDGGFRPTALYALGLDPAVAQGGFANYIAMYLVPIFVLSLSRRNVPVELRWFVIALLFTGIITTQSYAGIFALIGVLGIWILTRISLSQQNQQNLITNPIVKKYSLPILGVIIVGITVFGIWQFNTPKFQSLLDMNNRNSITTRVQIWDTSIAIIRENTVLGIGLADFQRVYAETIPEKYFPPYEWLVPEPHNLYFAFWLHLGLAGIIWLIYVLRYTILRLIEAIKSNQWETYWFSLSLLSIFIYGILDTPFWKNDLALLFLMILYGVVGKRKRVAQ
jgi:O-antigen ligase